MNIICVGRRHVRDICCSACCFSAVVALVFFFFVEIKSFILSFLGSRCARPAQTGRVIIILCTKTL